MGWEQQNMKSEKCEATSGMVLTSRKRAFKRIQTGLEVVISCIGDLSLKYVLQTSGQERNFTLNADHTL